MKKFIDMVTVAIPTYNGEKFLNSAVESIINQTCSIHKIIIVDDVSTDNTKKVTENIKNKFSGYSIESYLNEKNKGYAANWNKCFEYCKTKYLLILHQDDLLKKDSIERLLQFLIEHFNVALVGGNEDTINEKLELIYERNNREETKVYSKGQIYEFIKEKGSYIPCSSVMFDIEKISNVGYFQEGILASDELYWPKVLSNFPIAVLGEKIILRRKHVEQSIHIDTDANYNGIMYGAEKQLSIIPYYEKRKKLRPKIKKILKIKFALNCVKTFSSFIHMKKNKKIAINYLARAFIFSPLIVTKKVFWKHMAFVLYDMIKIYKSQ